MVLFRKSPSHMTELVGESSMHRGYRLGRSFDARPKHPRGVLDRAFQFTRLRRLFFALSRDLRGLAFDGVRRGVCRSLVPLRCMLLLFEERTADKPNVIADVIGEVT